MNTDELGTVYTLAVGFGMGAVIAAVVALLIIRFFLSSYLTEKGKNLATKEDISAITKAVEDVRAPFVEAVENVKGRHQLRLAAVDRRLQAHQEAFTLWRELVAVVHTPDAVSVVIKCQTWWEKNCVYLEAKVREGFLDAYSAAASHNQLTQGRSSVELVQLSWKRIMKFPDILFEAVELPGLSEGEERALKLDGTQGHL